MILFFLYWFMGFYIGFRLHGRCLPCFSCLLLITPSVNNSLKNGLISLIICVLRFFMNCVFQKKTWYRLKHYIFSTESRIRHQVLRMYSKSEVYRSPWRSTYFEIDFSVKYLCLIHSSGYLSKHFLVVSFAPPGEAILGTQWYVSKLFMNLLFASPATRGDFRYRYLSKHFLDLFLFAPPARRV